MKTHNGSSVFTVEAKRASNASRERIEEGNATGLRVAHSRASSVKLMLESVRSVVYELKRTMVVCTCNVTGVRLSSAGVAWRRCQTTRVGTKSALSYRTPSAQTY